MFFKEICNDKSAFKLKTQATDSLISLVVRHCYVLKSFFNHSNRVSKSTQYLIVADPDLQIRGARSSRTWDKGGGGWFEKKIFSALWASVSSKNKGGGGAPPGYATAKFSREKGPSDHACTLQFLGVWRQKRDKIDCHISSYSKLSLSTVKRLKFVFLTLISCDSAVPVECGLVCHVWNVYQATGETQFSALCHHW